MPRSSFYKCFKFLVGNVALLGFVVDGEQVNRLAGMHHHRYHPCAAAFTFSLAGDGQPYLVAPVAQRGAMLGGVFQQGAIRLVYSALSDGYFLTSRFSWRAKNGSGIIL